LRLALRDAKMNCLRSKPMKPTKKFPLRKIADSQVEKHFGHLDSAVRNELATSLVRQWITSDGYAGFVTPTRQYWFQMVVKGAQLEVTRLEAKGNWGRILSRDWHVAGDEIPALLHQLNLCQTVSWRTTDGQTIRLGIDPKERTVRCQTQASEEE
jgi:hypothetical protein